MNVKEAMTAPVKCCSASTSLDAIARMMWEEDCGSIPIVSDANEPLGIVTDRDIAMAAMINHQPLWNIPASQVIQGQRLACCSQQAPIDSCVSMMEKNGVRRILVTDEDGCLCGIVSLGDAVAFTQAEKANPKKHVIGPEQMLDMLRKVSSHHPSGDQPGAQA